MSDDSRSQVHTQMYYRAGDQVVKVNFTQAVASPDVAELVLAGSSLAEALVEAGFSPDYPDSGVVGEDEVSVVNAVMRRAKPSDGTVIIDFYPPEGKWKFVHEYVNNFRERRYIEEAIGLSFDDIPLYDGQASFDRDSKPHPKQRMMVRPLKTIRTPRYNAAGEKLIGKTGHPLWQLKGFAGRPTMDEYVADLLILSKTICRPNRRRRKAFAPANRPPARAQ